jgi:hypothetical protein
MVVGAIELRSSTEWVLLAAALIFVWALALGVWKYRQMATSEDHLAHPYVDTAHRAALLYSFATLLLATLVELSGWSEAVNAIAAGAVIAFFVGAIAGYMFHGARRDTTNQFADPWPNRRTVDAYMVALILAEIAGTLVLVTGFVEARLL